MPSRVITIPMLIYSNDMVIDVRNGSQYKCSVLRAFADSFMNKTGYGTIIYDDKEVYLDSFIEDESLKDLL